MSILNIIQMIIMGLYSNKEQIPMAFYCCDIHVFFVVKFLYVITCGGSHTPCLSSPTFMLHLDQYTISAAWDRNQQQINTVVML